MSTPISRVRAALRARIDGERQLAAIERIVEMLTQGHEEHRDALTGTAVEVPLDSARVSALRAALDAHFRLLGKVLPDLKAVEITGEDGAVLASGTTDKLVLATKLVRLMRETDEERSRLNELPDFMRLQ